MTGAGDVTFSGSGTTSIGGGYTLTGNTIINSGTVNFNAAVIIPSVTFNDGTLSGSGELTVTTALNWSDGTMSGSGKTIIPSSGVMTLSGGNEKFLSVRTLENSGTVNYSGSGTLDMRDGSTFTNQSIGLFDMQVDALIEHGFGAAPTFDNQGTFQKSGGPGTATVGVPFNNSSPVKVQNGTLSFTLGGSSSGNFDVDAGQTLNFGGGTHTLDGSSSVTGAGDVTFSSGTTSIGGGYTLTGNTIINSGTVNFDSTVSVPTVTFNDGTLSGTGELTVTGALSWSDGSMSGTGKTVIASGGVMTLSSTNEKFLSVRTLENFGTVDFTSTGTLFLENGATFTNQSIGLFDMQVNGFIDYNTGTLPTFDNLGTFQKSGGTGTATVDVTLDNSSPVQVQSGTLSFTRGGTSSGNFDVDAGQTLNFGGGTHSLDGSSSVTGAGNVSFSSGTTNIAGSYTPTGNTIINSGTVNFDITVSVPTVTFNDGTLSGSGELTVTSALNWSDGTMSGSGKTIIPSSRVMTISSTNTKFLSVRTVENSGTVNVTGTGTLFLQDGATFTNQSIGLFDMQVDGFIDYNSGTLPSFDNLGTFQKSGGTGTTTVDVDFNNTGTVEMQTGTLSFTRTYTQTAGTTLLNGGDLTSTQTLDIQGGALSGVGTVTGDVSSSGQVTPGGSAGILQIVGAYTQTTGGSLNIEIGGITPGTQFDQLNITGSATLAGTLNVTLFNSFEPSDPETFSIVTYNTGIGAFGTTSFPPLSGGGNLNITYGSTSSVLSVNEPPAISLPGGGLAYTENDGTAVIDSGATVSDIDSTDFDTGTLTVDFMANGTANDRLSNLTRAQVLVRLGSLALRSASGGRQSGALVAAPTVPSRLWSPSTPAPMQRQHKP